MKLRIASLVLACASLAGAQTKPEVQVPDHAVIPVVVSKSIEVARAKVGSEVKLIAAADVRDENGKVLIPQGAELTGKVTQAVPRSKQQPVSRLSILVERAEWKDGWAKLRAFIAGDVRILSSALRGRSLSEGAEALEVFGPTDMSKPAVPNFANTNIPQDKTVRLQMAEDPELVSELVSEKHSITCDQGSRFSLREWKKP